MSRIIVAEYEKSGGSWLTSMLGDALSLPKRDIYVSEGYDIQDLTRHPWYEGAQSLNLTDSCVIKSHELPDSSLHNFPACYLHLLRDGRDVVVSRYFFGKDFCVKNGIIKEFTASFDEFLEETAAQWAHFVRAWGEKKVVTCRYEDLLRDVFATLLKIFSLLGLDVPPEHIRDCIQANTKENMRRALGKAYKHNTFVRKGTAGDWRNHFSVRHKEIFKKQTGTLLIDLGYEDSNDW